MLVLFILYGDSICSGNADRFAKELIMDKPHMRTVDIGLKADIQNRLRQIIADIQGKLLPLLGINIRRKAVGNSGLRQKPVQRLCRRCHFGCVFVSEYKSLGIEIIINCITHPGGLDEHEGIEQMLLTDQLCQRLLTVNAVESTDDHSVRSRHQLDAVKYLTEAVVLGCDQDQIRPCRLLRRADIGKDLLSVDHKSFFPKPLRPLTFCDDTEVISKRIPESSDKKCADCTGTDQRYCPEFHILFLPAFHIPS